MSEAFYGRESSCIALCIQQTKEVKALLCSRRSIKPWHKTFIALQLLPDTDAVTLHHVAVITAIPGKPQVKSFIQRIEILVRGWEQRQCALLAAGSNCAVFYSQVTGRIGHSYL